jgi:hypothetical protein
MTIEGFELGIKCPICNQTGYCARSPDGRLIACMNKEATNSRYTEVFTEHGLQNFHIHRAPGAVNSVRIDMMREADRFARAMTPQSLARIADMLKVDPDILTMYGVGHEVEKDIFTMPVRNLKDWTICAFLLHRASDHRENWLQQPYAARLDGFFVPTINPFIGNKPITVIACRGLVSTLAVASLGFSAIGRTTAAGGFLELLGLMGRCPLDLIVVPDSEGGWVVNRASGVPSLIGWDGALLLCREILGQWNPHTDTTFLQDIPAAVKVERSQLRLMLPDKKYPSLHAMIQAGAGEEDVGELVANAVKVDDYYVGELQKKMEAEKKKRFIEIQKGSAA